MARYTNEIAERRKVLLPLDELRQLFDDARQTVVELSGRRRIWTMHIPAQQDDPDILLTDALRQAHLLLVEVERQRALIDGKLQGAYDPDGIFGPTE